MVITRRRKKMHALAKHKRSKLLDALAKSLRKKLKIEVVNANKSEAAPIAYLSTGHQAIDDVLSGTREDDMSIVPGSGKGLPRGRIVEIYGPEAAAKTSLALSIIAQAQKQNEECVFIDVEHALDPDYARDALGVDMDSLLWLQPENGEKALTALKLSVQEGAKVVVLDSVAALVTMDELNGGRALGQQARLMSKVCRELTPHLGGHGPVVIFINQIRYKIGVVFGNPEFTSGGNALKYYSSLRLEVRKKKELKRAGKISGQPVVFGNRIGLRVVKNKVAAPDGRCVFDVLFGKGIRIPKLRSKQSSSLDEESENGGE